MEYVFNRDLVLATGKGFVAGELVPDDLFTEDQIVNLMAQGFVKQVFRKIVATEVKPEVIEDEVEEEILDPIESLDPERKARKRK